MNKITINKNEKLKSLLKLVDKIKGFSIEHINNINFICSLAILNKDKKLNKLVQDNTTDILYSAKLVIEELTLDKIESMIFRNRNYIKSKNIHVILVSTNSNSDIDAITEPEIRELEVQKNISS